MTCVVGRALCASLLLLAACDAKYPVADEEPPPETLDVQLRQTIQRWGVAPILPVAAQNPALVDLGQALFFDKILSGNRDVSCATCHDPAAAAADGLSLPIGTGGVGTGAVRTLGAGRQFVPRNAPSLLNQGLGFIYMFWDGSVNEERGPGQFKLPTDIFPPAGVSTLLAAQAMLPVLNRDEMRGKHGDVDRFGQPNELATLDDGAHLAIWRAAMDRVLAIQAYQAKFNAAFPSVPRASLGFQHAATALAAFQIHAFTKVNTPFDRFLAGQNTAMTDEAKRGALLFFGEAGCSTCHNGPLLGGNQFANIGVPQIGPGVRTAAPLDRGRGEELAQIPFYQFTFRVQPLRNVELTAPYMHNGAYPTLEAVVRHYNHADSALRNYDPSHLPPALRAMYHGDEATIQKVGANLDHRLRVAPLALSDTEQRELVAFLKSLTDPAARNLAGVVPGAVPSGLSVRE